MPFLMEQMSFLHFLQGFRSPSVDCFFWFLNFFDTSYFISSLIAFIWIGCSWRWGVRFGYLMILSGWANTLIKLAFSLPRPLFLDPSLGIVKLYDYGFPSGGAQSSLLFACLLIYFWKNRWAWPVGIGYCLLISFSRMFLGVHFPVDVLGGWIIGFLLFILFIMSFRAIDLLASRHSTSVSALVIIFGLILGFVFRDDKSIFLAVSLIVMTFGVAVSSKYHLYLTLPQEWKLKTILGLFGIVSSAVLALFTMMLGLDHFLSLIAQAAVSTLWISLLASPCCKKTFLSRKR